MTTKETTIRRTQQERSEATTNAILDATLHCLATNGYVMTSIGRIVKQSGVSRGGLMHHYPSKEELVAAAFIHFHHKRIDRLQDLILLTSKRTLPLEERLQIFRQEIEEWFPISIEFLTASMKDPKMLSMFTEKIETYMEPMQEKYNILFPEFCDDENHFMRDFMIIIGCFIRGLCIDAVSGADQQTLDKTFNRFVEIVKFIMDNFDNEAGKLIKVKT